jgi:hypothetical protein
VEGRGVGQAERSSRLLHVSSKQVEETVSNSKSTPACSSHGLDPLLTRPLQILTRKTTAAALAAKDSITESFQPLSQDVKIAAPFLQSVRKNKK